MDDRVDVTLPVEPDAARLPEATAKREVAGRMVSHLLTIGAIADVLAAAIADAKGEARTNGLTDADVAGEIEARRVGP